MNEICNEDTLLSFKSSFELFLLISLFVHVSEGQTLGSQFDRHRLHYTLSLCSQTSSLAL